MVEKLFCIIVAAFNAATNNEPLLWLHQKGACKYTTHSVRCGTAFQAKSQCSNFIRQALPPLDLFYFLILCNFLLSEAGPVASDNGCKRAFDSILRNRLILQLRKQCWPEFVIHWREMLLAQPLANVRFEDAIAAALEFLCGIPQGSPFSLILYVLATAALYELPGDTHWYGYTDNTAMLFVGDTLS